MFIIFNYEMIIIIIRNDYFIRKYFFMCVNNIIMVINEQKYCFSRMMCLECCPIVLMSACHFSRADSLEIR